MSPDKQTNDSSSFVVRNESRSYDDSPSRGSFRREPPVVPERIAVLKANYKQAWLYFLLGVCLLIAWGIPIRYALIRTLSFRAADVGSRSAAEFVSIAYEGISDISSEVSPERFEAQMELLKEKGYNAITLEEVKAFYEEGAPLPEKAILLTFDHSRKSSYFDARRILQNLGWRAVMFVWTKPIMDEDPSALRWPYIRAMIGSGAWEAGAQSHLGFERIVSDSEGNLKNYLTSPRWLTPDGRYESPEEYQARLQEDHEFVTDKITKETKKAPIAFAFPYGDFGQYDERALLTRRLNLDLVDKYYDLAFIHGNAALNTRNSDPLRLNRLLVNPAWTAEQLYQRLESTWPREEGIESERALNDPLSWQVDWGGFNLDDNSAQLFALNDNTGSKVWLNGTDLYRDFQARFKLKISQGQVGLFLRASKDGERYLYLGLGDKGEVWLRQKHEGMEPFTLGTSRYIQEQDGTIDLEIFLRDDQFFASTGGEPVFDEIIITRGEIIPGIIGISVWDPQVAQAKFEILDMELEPFYSRLVTWEPVGSRRPYLAGWLGQNGFRFTHLSPPWLKLGDQGRSEQISWDPEFYLELANVYNMKFAPEVIVERIGSVEPLVAENLASRAKAAKANAVFCNLSGIRGASNLSRITTWIQNMSKALGDEKIQLIVSLPPNLSRDNTINSLLTGLSNIKIASTGETISELEDFSVSNQRIVSWKSIVLDASDYPLFNQLTGSDAKGELLTSEVRSRILWEEGFEAFGEGEFDEAIRFWARWSDVEPYNEKPLRLIGDVYLRKQDYGLAIDYYQRSLELNPGQVDLVVSTATLLEKFSGKKTEAAQLLSLYQRLFPDNSEIALAQAGLLLRDGKGEAAGARIQTVVDQNPDDLTALALLHPLLQSSEERVENFEKIKLLGQRLGMYEHFANTLRAYKLLIWPESWRIMDLVDDRASEGTKGSDIYQQLLPRTTVVREKFKLGSASSAWRNATGPQEEEEEGILFLTATPTSTEATLILEGSETMRNGFVEAELAEARGFFWLYARRSEGNMIRFGFEPSGRLYLQIWVNDKVITNVSREWERPSERVKFKLEVRGDAVFGYVNGRPAFGAPTQIPTNMNMGWWGMAPWAPQFGLAQAVVKEVAGGPLPVNIGIYRGAMEEGIDRILVEKLKPNTDQLTVFSPNWFFQDIGGEIRSQIAFDLPGVRLLTRYYKIRLYPLVQSASARTLDVSQLVSMAKSTRVSGFTLEFSRMPDEEWFSDVEKKLLGTEIGLLAIRMDSNDSIVEVRELGSDSSLIAGARSVRRMPFIDFTGADMPVIPVRESLSNRSVIVEASSQEMSPAETVSIEGTVEEDDEPKESVDIAESPRGEAEAPSITRPMVPDSVFLF